MELVIAGLGDLSGGSFILIVLLLIVIVAAAGSKGKSEKQH